MSEIPSGPFDCPLTALLVPSTDHLSPATSPWLSVVYQYAHGVSSTRGGLRDGTMGRWDDWAMGLRSSSLENHPWSGRDAHACRDLESLLLCVTAVLLPILLMDVVLGCWVADRGLAPGALVLGRTHPWLLDVSFTNPKAKQLVVEFHLEGCGES